MKTKIFLSFILSAVILTSSCIPSVWALEPDRTEKMSAKQHYYESVPVIADKSDFEYSVVNSTYVKLSRYVGSSTAVIIPDTIDGYPVRVMAAAFFENHSITYVKLPSSLKDISVKAFNLCDYLTEIEVDDSNPYFSSADGVLYSKDGTKLVTFPGGKTGSFTIPCGVTTIGDYAFDHCYGLTDINMYNSVTKIGAHAFSFCWNAEKIRLSDRLLELGSEALSHCDSYTEIHLPAALATIGQDALLGQTSSKDGSKEYYFTDGIFCVPGTYSYEYVQSLGVKVSGEERSVTDIDSGIKIIDPENKLPAGADIDVNVINADEVKGLFSVKYTSLDAFDVSVKNDGAVYSPKSDISLRLNFDDVNINAVVTASKIYRLTDTKALQFVKRPQDKSVETVVSVKNLGKFALLSSNSFTEQGDADGDGVITSYDALVVLCASLKLVDLTPAQKSVCKVNGVGTEIQTADARKILRYAAGVEAI